LRTITCNQLTNSALNKRVYGMPHFVLAHQGSSVAQGPAEIKGLPLLPVLLLPEPPWPPAAV
jgi:hypothetical protein